ncbi:hypothetical protein DF186_14670, partial [Enterococcus hirae]
ETVEFEEVCEEVEIIKDEYKEVDFVLVKCEEVFFFKLLLNIIFKWVKFLFLSFIFLFEYGLIENDG